VEAVEPAVRGTDDAIRRPKSIKVRQKSINQDRDEDTQVTHVRGRKIPGKWRV
jgi:hypothetical protein